MQKIKARIFAYSLPGTLSVTIWWLSDVQGFTGLTYYHVSIYLEQLGEISLLADSVLPRYFPDQVVQQHSHSDGVQLLNIKRTSADLHGNSAIDKMLYNFFYGRNEKLNYELHLRILVTMSQDSVSISKVCARTRLWLRC